MAPLSSLRRLTTTVKPSGPISLQADGHAAPGSMAAIDALARRVQQLVNDQASSQQQVQQMHASQAVVQCQMQALLAQLQLPIQPPPPTHPRPPPPNHIKPPPPPPPLPLQHHLLRSFWDPGPPWE